MEAYSSDTQLKVENDNFWIARIIKYFALVVAIAFVAFLLVEFICAVIYDAQFKVKVLETVWQQVGTIIVALGSILGLGKVFNK